MNGKQERFTKTVPLALAALGQHMHEHKLAVPISIDIDKVEQTLTVRVADEAGQNGWLNTLVIDAEDNEPWMGPVWVKTTWQVRLPDLGIRFTLRGLRRSPDLTTAQAADALTVVPA